MRKQSNERKQNGFSILEVVIGIFIFIVGMLALAALQGALTRSMADSKLRTTAVNLADRAIESQRGFSQLQTGGGVHAYNDIVSDDYTVDENGVTYTFDLDVTDYYYHLDTDTFTVISTGTAASDYKQVAVTVSWDAAQNFRANKGTEIAAANLGSGEVKLTAAIPAIITSISGRVADETDGSAIVPPVLYTPGANPDVIALRVGDNRFKESTKPVPKVVRVDELVETTFDVITYSTVGASAFLRREEFSAVSCECELNAAPGNAVGYRPTLWAGDEYTEAELVDKAYGVQANNIQSPRCEACCRDHHDGGTGSNDPAGDVGAILYDPFRASDNYWDSGDTFGGDHKHYKKDRFGNLSEAGNVGDVYVEACRMIRKDGFMRAGQDFRREGLNVFQFDFLDDQADITRYSNYTTGAVESYVASAVDGYESAPPTLTPPLRDLDTSPTTPLEPDELTYGYTYLPTSLGAEFQQLRSRGIYIDYLSEDLRSVITCIDGGGSAETCKSGDVELDQISVTDSLELIPFYDVQLTYLNRWNEDPPNDPVDTTNEALASDNTHSRGVASKEGSVGGPRVIADGNRGVTGITDTDPIDNSTEITDAEIKVIINNDNPPPPSGTLVTVTITSGVNGVQASSVEIEPSNATCDRTVEGFICLVPNGTGATIKLSNYDKQNDKDIVACSYEVTLPGTGGTDTASRPFTIFNLDAALDTFIYQISIENVSCF